MIVNFYEWVQTNPITGSPKVTQIIMLRNITGLGLREAKEVIDGFDQGGYRYLALPAEVCNGPSGPVDGRSGYWHLLAKLEEREKFLDDEYLHPTFASESKADNSLDHYAALASQLKESKQVASKLYSIVREMYDMTGYDPNVSALKDLADELAREYGVLPQSVNRTVTYKF